MNLAMLLVSLMLSEMCVGVNAVKDGGRQSFQQQVLVIDQSSQYQPEGGVNIRFRKIIFSNRDLSYIVSPSLIEETYLRKKTQLEHFQTEEEMALFLSESEKKVSLLHQVNFSPFLQRNQGSSFSQSPPGSSSDFSDQSLPKAYLSTIYYKNKNFFLESRSLTKEEQVLLPFSGLQFQEMINQNTQQGNDKNSGTQNTIEFPRDNSYLNFAFNIKTSYEVPIEKLIEIEQKQVIESFLEKRAMFHAQENLAKIQKIYNPDQVISVESFSKLVYTYENPRAISNFTDGITPTKIQDLKKGDKAFKFFNSEVEIFPKTLTFLDQEILIPRAQVLKIQNKNKKASIIINDILSTSPELSIYYDDDIYFPYYLAPSESLEVSVILIPETVGQFDAAIMVLLEQFVYIQPVESQVSENSYRLSPIYATDVYTNESVKIALNIFNSMSEELIIKEIYSTEPYLEIQWMNGVRVLEVLDYDLLNDVLLSQQLKVMPHSLKPIVQLQFQVSTPGLFGAYIHLRTSRAEIVKIPLYFHVHEDPIKFYPTVIDFGTVPLNFNQIRSQLKFQVKDKSHNYIIQDIYVPIDDSRLDFLLTDSNKLNIEKRPLRKGPDYTPMGNVILNPTKAGVIDSQIIILINKTPHYGGEGSSNQQEKQIRVTIPIIGYISSDSQMLQSRESESSTKGSFLFQQSTPKPIAQFDVSNSILNETFSQVLFKVPQFSQKTINQAFVLTNTFDTPILLKDIINPNPELQINIMPDIKRKLSPVSEGGLLIEPNQTIKIAWIDLSTSLLKISQGTKFITLHINNTLIPMSISIFDKSLLCVWEEEYTQIRFTQCHQNYDINFGSVAINEPKLRRLNITNMNPMSIKIDNIAKGHIDDLVVYIEKEYYKGQKVKEYTSNIQNNWNNPEQDTSEYLLIGPNKTHSSKKLTIHQFQTLSLVFMVVNSKVRQKSSRIDFSTVNSFDFSFNYIYNIISGVLTLTPYQLHYDPAFPGILQHKTITVKSTFDVPIVIKTISSSDSRILHKVLNHVIMPKNKSELAILTFDPSKSGSSIVSTPHHFQMQQSGQKQQLNSGSGLNQVDITSLLLNQLNGATGGSPEQFQQNLMQLLGGAQNTHFAMIQNQGGQIQISNIQNIPASILNQGNVGALNAFVKSSLTPTDLFQWREKHKIWLGNMGKTEIEAKITIETNIFQNIEIPVKAYLQKPRIVMTPEEDILNFHIVQLGTTATESIIIYNPSDETLSVQLYLGNEQYHKIEALTHEQAEKNNDFEKEFYRMLHHGINGNRSKESDDNSSDKTSSDQFSQSLPFEKESYISMYCAQKMRDGLFDESYIDEKVEVNELLVNQKADIIVLCMSLLDLADIHTPEGVELDKNLKLNLEPFFKELYVSEYGQIFGDSLSNSHYWFRNGKFGLGNNRGGTGKDGTNNILQHELKSEVDQITSMTFATPIDQQVTAYASNSKKSFLDLQFYSGLFDQIRSTLKQIFYDNYNGNSKQPSPYKLKNEFIQDIILNNGSHFKQKLSALLAERNLPSPTPNTDQSFFISQSAQGKYHTVEPKRNLTINNVILFQPHDIKTKSMTLFVRNNLTILYPIELRGSGGTGIIEILKVLKQNQNRTSPGWSEDILADFYENNSTQKRERITQFIYGKQQNEAVNYTDAQGKRSKKQNQDSLNEQIIEFSISIEDLLYFDDKFKSDMVSGSEQTQFSQLDRLLSDKSHQITVNNKHKRTLVAKNTGNLPLTVNKMSIEGKHCQGYGFIIENCEPFTLQPGEIYDINLSYTTDFSLAKVRKSLTLETAHFTLEYIIHVQIPIRFLQLAHSMLPLNEVEEHSKSLISVSIILLGGLALFYSFTSVLAHFKFLRELTEESLNKCNMEKDKLEEQNLVTEKQIEKSLNGQPDKAKKVIPERTIEPQTRKKQQSYMNEKESSQNQKEAVQNGNNGRMNMQKYFEKKEREDQNLQPVISTILEKEKAEKLKEQKGKNQKKYQDQSKKQREKDLSFQSSREAISGAKEEKKDISEQVFTTEGDKSQDNMNQQQISRSNTVDSAALNLSSLDLSRDGVIAMKGSEEKVQLEEEQKKQKQIKKKNVIRLTKKEQQRRDEILRQQIEQQERQKQEELLREAQLKLQKQKMEQRQKEERYLLEKQKKEAALKLAQEKQEAQKQKKRELPSNEQVTVQELKERKQEEEVQLHEVIEEEPVVEIFEQIDSAEKERSNSVIIPRDFQQSSIEKKDVTEFERQEDRIQEEQIMQIIEEPSKESEREDMDIQNDYSEIDTSIKKEDLSMEMNLPYLSPSDSKQVSQDYKNQDKCPESKKQNSQDEGSSQVPTNSQHLKQQQHQSQLQYQQQKKYYQGNAINTQTQSQGYYKTSNYREQNLQKGSFTGSTSTSQQQFTQPAYQKNRVPNSSTGANPSFQVSQPPSNYYPKRGGGVSGAYYQGRGQSYNNNYNVRKPGSYMRGSNYYYEEDNQRSSSYFGPSQQPVSSGPKRVVINTLKSIPQTSKYGKGRGYQKNAEFEEEAYEGQHYYGGSSNYGQSSYHNKRSREDYEEDMYNENYMSGQGGRYSKKDEQKYYGMGYDNRMTTEEKEDDRRNSGGVYDDYGDEYIMHNEEESENDRRYSEKERIKSVPGQKSLSYNKFVQEFANQKIVHHNKNTYESKFGEEQKIQQRSNPVSANSSNQNLSKEYKGNQQQRLSKNELEPFFESEGKEKHMEAVGYHGSQGNSFSLKSLFTPISNDQRIQSQQVFQSDQSNTEELKQIRPNQYKAAVQNQNQEQHQSDEVDHSGGIDYFNVFKSVNSIFTFGGGFGPSNEEEEQKDRQGSKVEKRHVFDYSERDQEQERQRQEAEDYRSSMLFSGNSLFGGMGTRQSQNYWGVPNQKEANSSAAQDVGETSMRGGLGSLKDLRKESKPVSTYSLFGNISKDIWGARHYQEDNMEEEDEDSQEQ